jgi:hypothetical protein
LSDRARSTGLFIIAASVIEFLLFIYGATRKSYLALALPITAAMATLTALGFWVGWTMMNLEEDGPEGSEPPVSPSP